MENTTIKTSPRDFFLYLLSNVSLYYCAGWLISLLYDYINYAFASTAYSYYGSAEWLPASMRWAIASIVIVFPVYIYITRMLNRELEAAPEKRTLRVRKWLIYLTLSLASIALVVDLIALLNQFLSGEFTTTFVLKVCAVGVVAGMVFAYYFYELRRDAGLAAPRRELFRWVALAFVAVSVVTGFFVVGSPTEARNKQYDARRISDLQELQSMVVGYYQRKQVLPTSSNDLKDPLSYALVPTDPETGAAYAYRATGARTFEICATFATDASGTGQLAADSKPQYFGVADEYWSHPMGEACFERTIDPELYPKIR